MNMKHMIGFVSNAVCIFITPPPSR